MNKLNEFTEDQRRNAIELGDLYDSWIEAASRTASGRLRWKTVNGTDYLYLLRPGQDTGRSLGKRDEETVRLFEEGQAWEERESHSWKRLLVKGRMGKAVHLPTVHDFAGRLLRELDIAGLLGQDVYVVGSMAPIAYEMAAGVRLPPDILATEDFDMAWIGRHAPSSSLLSDVIRKADASWTVSQEKTFQARNRAGYSLDLVCAPELIHDYPRQERLRALPIEGQDFLLAGTPVKQVVPDSLGRPAKIVAPDPRLFALHKLWLSQQPHRDAKKRQKDLDQSRQLFMLIEHYLPEYPLDDDFKNTLPEPLVALFDPWRNGEVTTAGPPKSKDKRTPK